MIEISEIKEAILNDALTIDLLVFLCKDGDHFIADQYINELCSRNGYSRHLISSLNEINKSSAFALIEDLSTDLHILRTETLKDDYDFNMLENTIIICDKIDKKLMNKLDSYLVEVPKLADWQVKAYINKLCPTLTVDQVDWLYKNAHGNISRINNELDKINLFDKAKAGEVLLSLKNDCNSDLFAMETFAFVDAVLKKDKLTIVNALNHLDLWDSDPNFILTLLYNKYKYIELVHGKSNLTAEDMKLTPRSYNAIKFYQKGHNLDEIRRKLKFISSINLRMNLGEFDIGNKSNFLTYLLNNLM